MTTSGESEPTGLTFDDDLFPDRLSSLTEEYGTWSDSTFPYSTTGSRMRHIRKESIELELECGADPAKVGWGVVLLGLKTMRRKRPPLEPWKPTAHRNRLMEVADIFLLLVHEAHCMGCDLVEAGYMKFGINRARTWAKTPEGTYEHDRTKD